MMLAALRGEECAREMNRAIKKVLKEHGGGDDALHDIQEAQEC